jgi:hypothetical protein
MKVIKKYYGNAIDIVNTEHTFGEASTFTGFWTNKDGKDKFIFLSDYEIRFFNNRAIKHPELVIPRRKRFLLLFKKGDAIPGYIYRLKNTEKIHQSESDEYLGFWLIVRGVALFLLMTDDDYEKILERSEKNTEDIPVYTYR